MNTFLKIFTLFMLITASGCKKILEEKQYSFFTDANFPTNEREAEAALNGAYNVLQESSLFRYTLAYSLATQDDLVHPVAPVQGTPALWMTFQVSGSDVALKNFWVNLWRGVNTTNAVISGLEKLSPDSNPWTITYIAEAKALRALYYFYLVRLYGDIPLRLEPTSEIIVKAPKAPATEIYALILDDLQFAENKLVTIANRGGRFTNGAVKALMAQVYITMAGWRRTSQGQMVKGDASYYVLARDKAREVIDMETAGIYQLDPDYTKVFKDLSSNVYNKEIILDVQFSMPDKGSNFPYFFGAQGIGTAAVPWGGGNAQARVNQEYVNELNINNRYRIPNTNTFVKDTRFTWNIANYVFSSASPYVPVFSTAETSQNFGLSKFQKLDLAAYFFNHPTNWPLLRLAEIKLIYAEADNEITSSPSAEAYKQINEIRFRARPQAYKADGTVLPDLRNLTKEQFREAVMQERAIELLIEGTRKFDLIRWGVLVERVRAAATQLAAGNVEDKHYLIPLPPEDILINGWAQNDGY